MPDYRGLFLRGVGGNSAGLGITQEDAGRNITGYFNGAVDEGNSAGGVFRLTYLTSGNGGSGNSDYGVDFDASRSWGSAHTASEFRPVNKAVRYLIRAKP